MHFIAYEAVVLEEGFSFFPKILTRKGTQFKPKDEKAWKIVDFDDFLFGNPHVPLVVTE